MKKIILSIVVAIVIIIVGWFFMAQQAIAPGKAATDESSTLSSQLDTPQANGDSTQTTTEGANTGTPPEITFTDSDFEADLIEQINYTNEGFNPPSIEIKKGQTIVFMNQSTGNMWVASAPHPTHTIYPEFDEKKATSRGDSYEFTFTKVGAWKYHNHLSPLKTGTIIVK